MNTGNNVGTLLQRRRRVIKVGKQETLLILRAYLAHPTNWADVLGDVRENLENIPEEARQLYRNGSFRQLRDRMSSKFGQLIKKSPEDIQDEELRGVIVNIQNNERRLQDPLAQDALDQHQAVQDNPPANDTREQAAAALSSSDAENDNAMPEVVDRPAPRQNRPRHRKRPLADLIRENHVLYNRLIKHKIPKLLRQLGVSSSDESD